MSYRSVKGEQPKALLIAQDINNEEVQQEAVKRLSDGELATAVVWEVVRNLLVKRLGCHAKKILQASSSGSALPPLVLFTARQPRGTGKTILGPSEQALQRLLAGVFYEDSATGAFYVTGSPDLFRVSLFERSDGTVRDVERAVVGPDGDEYRLHGHGFAERLIAGMYLRQGIGGADIPRYQDGVTVPAFTACEDGLDVKAYIQGGRQVLVDSRGRVEALESKPPKFLKEAGPDATGAVYMSLRSLDTISEAVEQHLVGSTSQAARHGPMQRAGLRAIPLNKDQVWKVNQLERASASERPEYGKGSKRATDAALLANGAWNAKSGYGWLPRPALVSTPWPLFVRRNELEEMEAQAAEERKRAEAEVHAGQAAASSSGGVGGGAGHPTGVAAPAGTGKGAVQVRVAPQSKINAKEFGKDKAKEQAKLKERVKGTCRLCGEEEGKNLENVWTHLCSGAHQVASAANAARLEPVSQAVNGSSMQQPTADEYALPLRVAAQAAVLNTEVGRQQHMLNGVFATRSIAANVEFVKQKKQESKRQSSSGKEETYTGKFRGPRGLGFVRPALPPYTRVLLLDGQTGEVLAATANVTFKDMMLMGAIDLCVDYQKRQEQHSSGGGKEPISSLPVVDASRCVVPCTDVRVLPDVHHAAFPSLRTLEILPQGPFTSESLATAGPGAMLLDDSPGMAHQVYKGLSTALLRQLWEQTCRAKNEFAATGGMEPVITPALWDIAGSTSSSSVPSQPATLHDLALARAIVTLDTSSSVMSALLEAAGVTSCPELTTGLRALLQALGVEDVQAAIDAEARVPRARPYPLVVGKSLHNGRALSALRHAAEQVMQSLANTASTESSQGAGSAMVPRQTSGVVATSASTAAHGGSHATPSWMLPSEPDLKAKVDVHAFQRTALALAPPHVRLGGPCLLLWLGLMEDDAARTKGHVPLPAAHTRGLPSLTPVLQPMYEQKLRAIAADEDMSGSDKEQLGSMYMKTKEWHRSRRKATSDAGCSQLPSAFVENATALAAPNAGSHDVTKEPQGLDACQAGAPLGEDVGQPVSMPGREGTAAEDGAADGPLTVLLATSEVAVLDGATGHGVQPAVSTVHSPVAPTSAFSAAACSHPPALDAAERVPATPHVGPELGVVEQAPACEAASAPVLPAAALGAPVHVTAVEAPAPRPSDASADTATVVDMGMDAPTEEQKSETDRGQAMAAPALSQSQSSPLAVLQQHSELPLQTSPSGEQQPHALPCRSERSSPVHVPPQSRSLRGDDFPQPPRASASKASSQLETADADDVGKSVLERGAAVPTGAHSDAGPLRDSAACHGSVAQCAEPPNEPLPSEAPAGRGRGRGRGRGYGRGVRGKHLSRTNGPDAAAEATEGSPQQVSGIGGNHLCADDMRELAAPGMTAASSSGDVVTRDDGDERRDKEKKKTAPKRAKQWEGCVLTSSSAASAVADQTDLGSDVLRTSGEGRMRKRPRTGLRTAAPAGGTSSPSAVPCVPGASSVDASPVEEHLNAGDGPGLVAACCSATSSSTRDVVTVGSGIERRVRRKPIAMEAARCTGSTPPPLPAAGGAVVTSPAAVASPARERKRKRDRSHQTDKTELHGDAHVTHGEARALSQLSERAGYSHQASSAQGMSQQAEKASKGSSSTVATALDSSGRHQRAREVREEDNISLGRESLPGPLKVPKSEFEFVGSPSSQLGVRRSSRVAPGGAGTVPVGTEGGQRARASAAGWEQRAVGTTKVPGAGLDGANVNQLPASGRKRKPDAFAYTDDDEGAELDPSHQLPGTAGKRKRSASEAVATSVLTTDRSASVLQRLRSLAPTPIALSSKLPCSTPAAGRQQPAVDGATSDRQTDRRGKSADPSAVSPPHGAGSYSTTGGQMQGQARSSPRLAPAGSAVAGSWARTGAR